MKTKSIAMILCLSFTTISAQAGLVQVMKLNRAVAKGNVEKIRELLAAGVDPNLRSPGGETPIMYTGWKNRPEVVSILVEAGADVNTRDETGRTAVMIAAEFGSADVVRALIDHGADVNVENMEGWTPLMRAAKKGSVESVTALLEAGAWTTPRNSEGSAALTVASTPEIRKMLQETTIPAPEDGSAPQAYATARRGSAPTQRESAAKVRDEQTGATLSFREPCPQIIQSFMNVGLDRPFKVDVLAPNADAILSHDSFYNLADSAVKKILATCKDSQMLTRIELTVNNPSFREPAGIALFRQGFGAAIETGQSTAFSYQNYAGAQQLRQKFWQDNGVQATPSPAEIVGNPFSWEGQTVAVPLTFVTMEEKTTGRFSGDGGEILIKKITPGAFARVGQRAYVAGHVLGKEALPGTESRFSTLEFKAVYLCRREDCGDILAVRPGESMEQPPQTGATLKWPLELPGDALSDRLWLACGDVYEPDKRHLGADLPVSAGKEVYPVAEGEVFKVSRTGWGAGNAAVVVTHTVGGVSFLAVYGHIETDLVEEQTVEPDRPVGRIGRYFDENGARADHLHLGIHPGCCPVIDGIQDGWGRKTDVGCVAPNNTNGFVAPVQFLRDLGLS